jgi:periplasmic divalent cation tolerance protein
VITVGEFVVGHTTLPDLESAQRMARELVERRAAACVQLSPITSVYRWQEGIEESAEILLLIKTVAEKQEQVRGIVLRSHPYEIPEIIFVTVAGGHPPYLDWILASTAG